MKKKSDAHEGLSLLAQRDGVPLSIIMDGSKEQTDYGRVQKEVWGNGMPHQSNRALLPMAECC